MAKGMVADEENVTIMFSTLAHPLRREILEHIDESGELSFTDLMKDLDMNTGKLSFHLRNLRVLLKPTPDGKYKLSNLGRQALKLIQYVEVLPVEIKSKQETPLYLIASLKRRLAALLLDLALVFSIFMLLTILTSLISYFVYSELFQLDFNVLLFLIFLWMYSTLLEGIAGQTLGKQVLSLKVVKEDFRKISVIQAAVRNFGKCFLFPIDLVVGAIPGDRRFKRYFDRYSGTLVIDLHISK